MLARTPKPLSCDALVQARNEKAREQCIAAAQRVAAGQMPRCAWAPSHRYQVVGEEDGQVIECCMDCGWYPRTYPVGTSSKQAKPFKGSIEAISLARRG